MDYYYEWEFESEEERTQFLKYFALTFNTFNR